MTTLRSATTDCTTEGHNPGQAFFGPSERERERGKEQGRKGRRWEGRIGSWLKGRRRGERERKNARKEERVWRKRGQPDQEKLFGFGRKREKLIGEEDKCYTTP